VLAQTQKGEDKHVRSACLHTSLILKLYV